MKHLPSLLVPLLVLPLARATSDAGTDAPWVAARDLQSFSWLLERSPFSLPTAEESSPLADRYALTGAAGIGGEALVFVFDRTTQARHMLSKQPNAEAMSLVEFLPDPDPRRMRATIRVGGEIATIAFQEAGNANSEQAPAAAPVPANGPQPPAAAQPAPPSATINPPAGDPSASPPRRVIRRRIITGQ